MALEESTKISHDLVVAAYRALLGREPESENVIHALAENHRSAEDLLRAFLRSEEFRKKATKREGEYIDRVATGYRQRLDISTSTFHPTISLAYLHG